MFKYKQRHEQINLQEYLYLENEFLLHRFNPLVSELVSARVSNDFIFTVNPRFINIIVVQNKLI